MVKKYTNNECNKQMTFEECELAILRSAVDKIQKKKGRKLLFDDEVIQIISIVEEFIKNKKFICYGGTAINNILPEKHQFYDKNYELPDYDFFSTDPMKDAKSLADIYYVNGFTEVEAKAGIHFGTYKVFVNFIPVADITYLHPELFKALMKDTITIDKIHYASPNFLRMSMYLELSRPNGNVGRWEKVLKRLSILNKVYPLKGIDCNFKDIQRSFVSSYSKKNKDIMKKYQVELYEVVRDTCIDIGVVFFGAFANSLYLKEYKKDFKVQKIPDFDILSEKPLTSITIIKERLEEYGYSTIKVIEHEKIGELIAKHYELKVGNETLLFVYEPLACHSYNTIKIQKKNVNIASIDTMLSFYLAFLYSNKPYYNSNRILCMSEILFKVQQKNRLSQSGILKRFNDVCYGTQMTIEDIRQIKTNKYRELKQKYGKSFRKKEEFQEWFLNYNPNEEKKNNVKQNTKTKKKKMSKQKSKTRKIH